MDHPDLEDLAAYIEGKLSRAERAAITAHLAECDECFQVFAEAVRIGQEAAAEATDTVPGGGPAPLPFERRKSAFSGIPGGRWLAPRWLPAAAAAVLVLGLGIVAFRSLAARPDVSNPQVVAALQQVPWSADEMAHGSIKRGPGDSRATAQARDFQLGVLGLDLQLSLPRDEQTASEICRKIGVILGQNGFLEQEKDVFFDAARKLRNGTAPPNLEQDLVWTLDGAKQSFSPLFLDFGRWAEAGRLSAIAKNDRFFQERDNWRFLDVLRKDLAKLEAPDLRGEKQEVVLPPEVRSELVRIARLWDNHPASFAELEKAFDRITKYYFQLEEDESLGPD